MTPLEFLQDRKEAIRRIAAQHGAYNVRVFGSVVRGEAGPESDIDCELPAKQLDTRV